MGPREADLERPLVLAITGASGVAYALRLLEVLLRSGRQVQLTLSPSGQSVLRQELGLAVDLNKFQPLGLVRSSLLEAPGEPSEFQRTLAGMLTGLRAALQEANAAPGSARLRYQHYQDFFSPLASGSFLTAGMVICPCSGSTLSAVVHGASNNLIQRAADVHLKERRKLILVPRETPLSAIQLHNMQRACEAGAVVLPAMPGWYHGVRTLQDLIDFMVARILDQLQIEHSLMPRWGACSSH